MREPPLERRDPVARQATVGFDVYFFSAIATMLMIIAAVTVIDSQR
jgi:hypothetical protein